MLPPITFGAPETTYVDGGMGNNNPIRALLAEASQLWPSRAIGCVVSIGMGQLRMGDVGQKATELFKTLAAIATDTEETATQVALEMSARYGVDQRVYHRFNVDRGLEDIGLEEWKNFGRVQTCTSDYLRRTQGALDHCSRQLRDPRRM